MRLIRKLLADVTGGSATEYGFVLGIIAVGMLIAVEGLGAEVGNSYNDTAQSVSDANEFATQ